MTTFEHRGEAVTVRMNVIQLPDDRRVMGGLLPGKDSICWQFENAGKETQLVLSQEATQAMVTIYAHLLRQQTADEWIETEVPNVDA